MTTYLFEWRIPPEGKPLPASMDYSPLHSVERTATQHEIQHWDQCYQRILEVERCLMGRTNAPKGDHDLVYARIVGYFLLYLPKKTQRSTFVDDLNTHIQSDMEGVHKDGILSLGKYMNTYLFRIFKDSLRQIEIGSHQETLSEYEAVRANFLQDLDESTETLSQAKLRALERDGYRCMLTGLYDRSNTVAQQRHQEHVALAEQGQASFPHFARTNLCHIIAECSNAVIDKDMDSIYLNANSASHMWNLLEMFGYAKLNELNGDKIHRLENVLTLTEELHSFMDSLELWFEGTETPNNYKVCLRSRGTTDRSLPEYVTFKNQATIKPKSDYLRRGMNSREPFPLPDPRYLELHAICCRVAAMSGAAEVIDEMERDMEETRVLANDGSDAHLLDYKLVVLPAHPP